MIRKYAKKLPSNFELDRYGLHVRLVREEDAEFIVRLRTDSKLGHYIHSTSSDVSKQVEWIKDYRKRETAGTEYYFIFETIEREPVGVVRIYKIEEDKYTSGSWLAKSNIVGAGVLCDIIAREIAFELYPDSVNYYDVRKGNKKVIRYHQSYHPTIYKEDEENVYFYLNKQNFDKYKKLYIRMAKL